MSGHLSPRRPSGVRRARRTDIAALLPVVVAPPAARVRALRRLLASLATDVYVQLADDGSETLTGVVAVGYRRSLRHGGLVGTIDTLAALAPTGRRDEGSADTADRNLPAPAEPPQLADALLEELLACAAWRAGRRGCVALEAPGLLTRAGAVAQRAGFTTTGEPHLVLLLDRAQIPPVTNTAEPEERP